MYKKQFLSTLLISSVSLLTACSDDGNTDVTVTTPTSSYRVGGQIEGLEAPLGLRLNGGEEYQVEAGAEAFTMPSGLPVGIDFSLQISSQPQGQICTIENATGPSNSQDINSLAIRCATSSISIVETTQIDGADRDTISRTINAQGQLLAVLRESSSGTVSSDRRWQYNSSGNLVSEYSFNRLMQYNLYDESGLLEQRFLNNETSYYTYDAGQLIGIDVDTQSDGNIDRVELLQYDAQGRLTQHRFDDNNSFDYNRTSRYTYTEQGWLSTKTEQNDINNPDDVMQESYSYFDNGLLQSKQVSENFATPTETRYEYNSDNQVTRILIDVEMRGSLEEYLLTYEEGNLIGVDQLFDGVRQSRYSYFYNASGQVLSYIQYQVLPDGRNSRVGEINFLYNEQGQLIQSFSVNRLGSTTVKSYSYNGDSRIALPLSALDVIVTPLTFLLP